MSWISLLSITITLMVYYLGHPFVKRWISKVLHWEPEWWFDFVRFVLFHASLTVTVITIITTQQARELAEESVQEAQEKVIILEEKVVKLNPYQQPLATFAATMQLLVKSDTRIRGGSSQGGGAFLLFAKGKDPLLWAKSIGQSAFQIGDVVKLSLLVISI
jgi:hypothetical protein